MTFLLLSGKTFKELSEFSKVINYIYENSQILPVCHKKFIEKSITFRVSKKFNLLQHSKTFISCSVPSGEIELRHENLIFDVE